MRLLFKLSGFLLMLAAVLAASVLAWGHINIRRVAAPLPPVEDFLAIDRAADLPVRISWVNTASQAMPRSAVLDPGRDPDPSADYVMSHPAFVVEWQDGRLFLIDMGMHPVAAASFGKPLQMVVDALPIDPHETLSERLGEDRNRVSGIGFTHLHTDHTAGIEPFCEDWMLSRGRLTNPEPVPVFQNLNQVVEVNHTTRPARRQLEQARCARLKSLHGARGVAPVPGFPGLFVVPVAGHTPGSMMFVVHVRVFPGDSKGRYDDIQTWLITGDVVNHQDAIDHDIPKPLLYSWLVVPEDDETLARVRTLLAKLDREPGVQLLVPHDQAQIESTGLTSH